MNVLELTNDKLRALIEMIADVAREKEIDSIRVGQISIVMRPPTPPLPDFDRIPHVVGLEPDDEDKAGPGDFGGEPILPEDPAEREKELLRRSRKNDLDGEYPDDDPLFDAVT